jgi:AraC-like DNA-binding protein
VRYTSFVGGLHERQVTTEHPGDAGRRDRAAAEAVARLLRFERARELAGTMPWGELAFECGFSDQSHLIAEFRRLTGLTPGTFLQDTVAQAA